MKTIPFKPCILIIESDILVAMLIRETLKEEFEVHHIMEGYAFYNQIKNHNYDLIICNMVISFLGGVELFNTLRYQFQKNTPFILLSATEDTDLLKGPPANDKNNYLLKPFSREELKLKAQQALALAY